MRNVRRQALLSILGVLVLVWSLTTQSSWLGPRSRNTSISSNSQDHHYLLHPTEETFVAQGHSAKEQQEHQGGLSNQAKATWCPQATCPVTTICHPCKRRYLILLAAGRSGSTTLLHMLNSLPGIRLSGENNGVLHNFQYAIDKTRSVPNWQTPNTAKWTPPTAWSHHPVTSSNFACVTQQMVEVLTPPPAAPEPNHDQDPDDDHGTIIGFKTIRFPQLPQSKTVEFHNPRFPKPPTPKQEHGPGRRLSRQRLPRPQIQSQHQQQQQQELLEKEQETRWNLLREAAVFLNETFPCGRFIISIRNPHERAKSVKRAFHSKQSMPTAVRESQQKNQNLLDLATLLGGPQRFIVLNSSEWTQNITILNDMVSSWLGFDKACHFDQLFELNTQGKGYGRGNVTSRSRLPPGCTPLPF